MLCFVYFDAVKYLVWDEVVVCVFYFIKYG
uniref:Uncharacterized protein n=1 Tax=Rhizophora mucronata TaxID=61149 RepID=A0A2P2R2Y2_RHIMU